MRLGYPLNLLCRELPLNKARHRPRLHVSSTVTLSIFSTPDQAQYRLNLPLAPSTRCNNSTLQQSAAFSTTTLCARRHRSRVSKLTAYSSAPKTSFADGTDSREPNQAYPASQTWHRKFAGSNEEEELGENADPVVAASIDLRPRLIHPGRRSSRILEIARSHVHHQRLSVRDLEEAIKNRASNRPEPAVIHALLTILIQKYGIMPAPRHYEALLLSNCSPAGSSKQVQEIWNEIQVNNIEMTTSILQAALSALAVHPAPNLQKDILATYDGRWLHSAPSIEQNLIISVMRIGQLELANAMLNDLHSLQKSLQSAERTPGPLYLYTLFFQHLVAKKDYDAVMRFIYRLRDRNATDMDLPARFWSWLLCCAAKDGDGWVTGWIWQEWVEKMKVKPSRGTCNAVLQIAARDKVGWLAESVRATIEHGGVSTRSISHRQYLLPNRALSDQETELINTSHGSVPELAGNEGLSDADPANTTLLSSSRSRRRVKAGNMWPFFDHTAAGGSGRFDPWDALGPKSRRR